MITSIMHHSLQCTVTITLTYGLSIAKLNANGCRWEAELSDFHFIIKYRNGKENVDSDSLSRVALDMEAYMKECSEELSYDVTGAATTQAVKNVHC